MIPNIERTILCTVLENDFINNDERIRKFILDHEYFTLDTHKVIVKAINRLIELGEPANTDNLRHKMIKHSMHKTSIFKYVGLDDVLTDIISSNAVSYEVLKGYYDILKKDYQDDLKQKALMYI